MLVPVAIAVRDSRGEPLGQCYITIVIGISIFVVVGPLPAKKLLIERILFFLTPGGKLFLCQWWTEVITNEYPEQVDFAKPSPEIVTA